MGFVLSFYLCIYPYAPVLNTELTPFSYYCDVIKVYIRRFRKLVQTKKLVTALDAVLKAFQRA